MTALRQDDILAAVWRACDTFRGAVDATQYKDYVLTALFLKYISDVRRKHVEEFRREYSGDELRIQRRLDRERFKVPVVELKNSKTEAVEESFLGDFYSLHDRRARDNIGELINIVLDAIENANEGKLGGLFRAIDFNSETNLGQTKDRNRRLKTLLEDFAKPGLDLSDTSEDILGDAYIFLIERFASDAGKKAVTVSPQFTTSEAGGAQLQALHTLINCGWRYVTRAEADQWRDGRRSLPFLETQLRADLARINRFQVDGRAHLFSEANIDAAVKRLFERIPEGVVRANERMTDDLMLGIALPQTIGATSREWPFRFIDWSDWRSNTFQVTSEYTVSEPGGPTIRVDLVLFVNGIPLGVIEVKASHVSSEQGVSQQIRNQKSGEGVPALFYPTQFLLAANSHDPRYGTVGTPHRPTDIENRDSTGGRDRCIRAHQCCPRYDFGADKPEGVVGIS